jgi:hypothetical protein
MKKIFVHLLMAVLLISITGLCSCRAIKKDRARSDSTVTRYESEKHAWESEGTQEFIIDTDDVALLQSGLSLPAILGMITPRPAEQAAKHAFQFTDSAVARKAPPVRGRTKLIFRSSSKASGQQSTSRAELRQVSTDTRITAKQPNPWSWQSIALIIVGVVVIALIITRSKQD